MQADRLDALQLLGMALFFKFELHAKVLHLGFDGIQGSALSKVHQPCAERCAEHEQEGPEQDQQAGMLEVCNGHDGRHQPFRLSQSFSSSAASSTTSAPQACGSWWSWM